MPSFDFITNPDFRSALEADHGEMERCKNASAWKSVQVLAGSIVEALLLDYLTSTTHPARPSRDPLKLDLTDAVDICRSEGVLTDRTADLSAVVRSYRNLIHPGRIVRLGEAQPTEETANIAASLVTLIIKEVAIRRRAEFGLTAEQIIAKVERDADSLGILRLLLRDVHQYQRGRLLDLIPPRYLALRDSESYFEDFSGDAADRLRKAYRVVFDTVTDEERRRVTSVFVQALREADGDYITQYRTAFFDTTDLQYLDESSRPLAIRHLITTAPNILDVRSARYLANFSDYLDPSDVRDWLDPFARAIISGTDDEDTKGRIRSILLNSIPPMPTNVAEAVSEQLMQWAIRFRERGQSDEANTLAALSSAVDDAQLPF